MNSPTALIAEDEPLLRQSLTRQLAGAWPELRIVAEARNGREALACFEALLPDVCFLDVRMPGLSGVEVARAVNGRAHVVFVTAYEAYAVEAFAQGAVDYLVKPVVQARLAETVARLRQRLGAGLPAVDASELLTRLEGLLGAQRAPGPLRWLQAGAGQSLRMIAVEDIDYLRSDAKYTRIAWRDGNAPTEAVVRTPLKDLAGRLDPEQFMQVHRSVLVNRRAIERVVRHGEIAHVHLRGRSEVVPVSRSYLHLFRGM